MLTEQDRHAIGDLMIRYCNMIDERRFSRYAEVFTPTARYDLAACGFASYRGTDEIIAFLKVAPHPLLHLNANLELTPQTGDLVQAFSRCVAIGADGQTLLATYHDVVLRTPSGWRLGERVVVPRGPDTIPEVS